MNKYQQHIDIQLGREILSQANASMIPLDLLGASILRAETTLTPSITLEFCKRAGEPLSLWLSSPATIGEFAEHLDPLSEQEFQSFFKDLLVPVAIQKDQEVLDVLERIYVKEDLSLSEMATLFQIAVFSGNHAISSCALIAIIQHNAEIGNQLALSMSQHTDNQINTIGREFLPYCHPDLAALEAERLLNEGTVEALRENHGFISESISMWWRFSGANHFQLNEKSIPSIEEFKKVFNAYSQEAVPNKKELLHITKLIAQANSNELTHRQEAVSEIKKYWPDYAYLAKCQ